jgi:protein-tyrosine phosphatase
MAEPRPWKRAIFWLAGLVPFFFLTYNFANWVTSQRHDVRSIVFDWEHRIPFLAWTIVPYWTTDAFYLISMFLCRTRRELDAHAKRLLAAQIISVVAFLLFPLQFTFGHPKTTGLYGFMFNALGDFDKPFNQAPSLHLSLTTILWAKYSDYLRGWPLYVLRAWLVLTGLSTLTTYQHHFIDLPTGIWVGLFCIVLFPDRQQHGAARQRDAAKLSAVYLAGSVLLGAIAFWRGGAGWLLLWPAAGLGIVAAVYWTGHSGFFKEQNGAIDAPLACLLGPYLAGAWLNSRWWTRREPAAQEVAKGVWLGRLPRRAERDQLGIASVVDLAAELPIDAKGITYRGVPMLDLMAPTSEQLDAAAQAIEEMKFERPTLVCCALGYSRSAAAVTAWLVASGGAVSIDEAVAAIQACRPSVVLNPAYRASLEKWASARARNGR